MSNSDFTKLRKEQLLLIRIALEDFYHSQCRNDDSCDTAYYKDLNRNLVKVNGNRLQFISTTKTIAGGAKELKRLLDQYVKKQIENGNLKEKENYPSIKIKSPTPIDSKKSKSGSQIVDVFSTDTIEDILKVAAYVNLIEKPTSVGLNFIFMDFDKSRNPEQTIEHLQEKWVLDTKSLSLKKNKKYEIPVDFMTLIEYHTQHFIERKTVISKFETFIQTRKHGYFILKGEPGVGKTALLAHYAKEYNHPCYFIRKAQGINRFEDFIDSICEQMCFKYYEKLGYLENELEDNCDINLFNRMLEELANVFKIEGGNLVIVIDALDEIIQSESTENVLKLPEYVPDGVYFLISQRPKEFFLTSVAPLVEEDIMRLMGDGWKQDFRKYFIKCLGISKELVKWTQRQIQAPNKYKNAKYVREHLINSSDGNFRFFKNVLIDIERGLFSDIENVPKGLESYYQAHLNLMGITSSASSTKLHLLKLLVKEKWVSAAKLRSVAPDARAILEEWEQFLNVKDEQGKIDYSLYHPSFGRFILDSNIFT